MKIAERIKKSDKTLFTFELLPPLKGDNIGTIHEMIEPLLEFSPAYINVTYHREEVVYKKRDGGLLEKKIVRKRPGTVGITAAIKFKYKIEVIPHIICGGFSREETENALIDLHFLGIHNLLVLRGDVPKSEKYFVAECDGHEHAIDLVRQVQDLNKGIYLDDEVENKTPTDFSIGVAGYPEKHAEAPNMQSDLRYLKQKIEAGAEYIVTQMFYDNAKYFSFVKQCRAEGIDVPIIPGIKPIASIKQINMLPQTFNIDIPNALAQEIEKCKNNEQAREVGVEWTTAQAKELLKAGVPALHFFTMGRADNIRKIAKAVF
ncbi:MAG: methylenetetrahydrofolate reductase [NAD(P)H] [Bacteroidota bacterium]